MVRLSRPQEDSSQEARVYSPTTWEQRGPLGDLRVQTLLSSVRGQRLKAAGLSEGQAAWKVLVAGGPAFTEVILGGTRLPRSTGMRGQTLAWDPLSSPTDARLEVKLRESWSAHQRHMGILVQALPQWGESLGSQCFLRVPQVSSRPRPRQQQTNPSWKKRGWWLWCPWPTR